MVKSLVVRRWIHLAVGEVELDGFFVGPSDAVQAEVGALEFGFHAFFL